MSNFPISNLEENPNYVAKKESIIALLEFIQGLQVGLKYKVNQLCQKVDICDLRVICGLDSETKEPVIPVELQAGIVRVSDDKRIENAVFLCSLRSLAADPLSFGQMYLLGTPIPESKTYVHELGSEAPAIQVPNVVVYGNAGGIDNHLTTATITAYNDLNALVKKVCKEGEHFKDGVKVFGINNPSLRFYAYDDRIDKFVWMLVGDHVNDGEVTPSQFVRYCYFEDGSDRLMTLNQSVINRQIKQLIKNN